jgi:hypothetical protein
MIQGEPLLSYVCYSNKSTSDSAALAPSSSFYLETAAAAAEDAADASDSPICAP